MTIQQPIGTDYLSSPDHSLAHRVFANDGSSAVKAVVVDASNNTLIGDGGTTNYVKIDSAGEMSFVGTAGVVIPHLMQSDTTDQAIANVANAQVITFNTDVHHSGITRTSSSRFTITKVGSYLLTFSGIAVGAINETIEFWLRINGDDVANSNTKYTFKSNGGTAVIACSFIEHFAVDDYFEFWTWGSAVTSKWDATTAGTSPTRPATPSIIMTANYVGKD